jgi:hypothetical protein
VADESELGEAELGDELFEVADVGVNVIVAGRIPCAAAAAAVTIRCGRRPFGSTRDNPARRARSVHSSRGLGFARRSTATSWRRTSISAFFDADDRASSASQDSTATPNRWIRRICTREHHRRSEPVAVLRTYYRGEWASHY